MKKKPKKMKYYVHTPNGHIFGYTNLSWAESVIEFMGGWIEYENTEDGQIQLL